MRTFILANERQPSPVLDSLSDMARADVERTDVLAALAEHDALGSDRFLDKYGFKKATSYLLLRNGQEYDSNAIFAAAHGHHPGLAPLAASEFSGGVDDAVKYLRLLGFRVPPSRAPDWTRDEVILVCDLLVDTEWKWRPVTDTRVQELSALLQLLPLHSMEVRGPKFRNANGVGRKMQDLATRHPTYTKKKTNGSVIDDAVVADFVAREDEMRGVAEAIKTGIRTGELIRDFEQLQDVDDGADDDSAPEGRLLVRRHLTRERDPRLRQRKIERHLESHSSLACATCGFDFEAAYGQHGAGYIECHHVVPLSELGETTTKLVDLVLICANCHRMIHRKNPWLTLIELQEQIAMSKSKPEDDG